MRNLPAYDPYLDTILCIRSAHHSPDEEAALIQNVFDALHLVQHRRPKRAAPVVEAARMEERPSFMPALLLPWGKPAPEACHA